MDPKVINEQITDFAYKLQKCAAEYISDDFSESGIEAKITSLIYSSSVENPWFVAEHIRYALVDFSEDLRKLAVSEYKTFHTVKTIAVYHRLNAPLEGIIELVFLSLSGFKIQVNVPSELEGYFKRLISIFNEIPVLSDKMTIVKDKFRTFDAIIALGQITDTAKSYFSKVPFLQLNSTGLSYELFNPESIDYESIADQCCVYFGRSGNNIKKLILPDDFNLNTLSDKFDKYIDQLHHNKYFNNYEYRKAAMIINKIEYSECGPLLITEDQNQYGYIGVLCVFRVDKNSFKNIQAADSGNLMNAVINPQMPVQSLSSFQRNISLLRNFLTGFEV